MASYRLLLIALCILLTNSFNGIAAENIIRGTDAYEFVYRLTLPRLSQPARLWVPVARSDAFQTVEWTLDGDLRDSRQLEENKGHNKLLYWELSPEQSGRNIELRYRVRRSEKAVHAAENGDLRQYLNPERLVPRNETFQTIATETTRGKADDMERGRAIYDHVLGRMRYDKSGKGWGQGDAMYACDSRAGNCTDFHAYFIALCRAVEIPARFAIGFTIPSQKNEGDITGYHCWAEFFADGKWVPVDISEAAQHPELKEYYFGHHPANRLELTTGRDLVVEPAPATGTFNFLVYPYLEMGGSPVATENKFSFRRIADQ